MRAGAAHAQSDLQPYCVRRARGEFAGSRLSLNLRKRALSLLPGTAQRYRLDPGDGAPASKGFDRRRGVEAVGIRTVSGQQRRACPRCLEFGNRPSDDALTVCLAAGSPLGNDHDCALRNLAALRIPVDILLRWV